MIIGKLQKKHEPYRRDGYGRGLRLIILGVMIGMCCACAAFQGQSADMAGTENAAPVIKLSADTMVMREGMSWLSQTDKPADYGKAREIFQALTRNYPDSAWRPTAVILIRLIDTLQSSRDEMQSVLAKSRADQALAEKLKEENAQLRKEIGSLGSRCQAERAGLLQENEQLKKDMELLKKLEIQLDRREKMLR